MSGFHHYLMDKVFLSMSVIRKAPLYTSHSTLHLEMTTLYFTIYAIFGEHCSVLHIKCYIRTALLCNSHSTLHLDSTALCLTQLHYIWTALLCTSQSSLNLTALQFPHFIWTALLFTSYSSPHLTTLICTLRSKKNTLNGFLIKQGVACSNSKSQSNKYSSVLFFDSISFKN